MKKKVDALVSIIIPTYNRSQLLKETLDSVKKQTYKNWECIIIDDGSSEKHLAEIRNYLKSETRFKLLKRPVDKIKGAPACRNYGLKISHGSYLMWLDDDDLIDKNKLLYQYQALENKSRSISTCAWGRFSNEDDYFQKEFSIYRDYHNPRELLVDYGRNEFFPPHSFMITRDLLDQHTTWDESLSINQDAVFFCRLILASDYVFFVSNTHVRYRVSGATNISQLKNLNQASDLVSSWKQIQQIIRSNGFKADKYIDGARRHTFTRLKEKGYKSIIFRNSSFFYKELIAEGLKRLKRILS